MDWQQSSQAITGAALSTNNADQKKKKKKKTGLVADTWSSFTTLMYILFSSHARKNV